MLAILQSCLAVDAEDVAAASTRDGNEIDFATISCGQKVSGLSFLSSATCRHIASPQAHLRVPVTLLVEATGGKVCHSDHAGNDLCRDATQRR